MLANLNGSRIVRRNATAYIILPPEAWRSAGLCSCPECAGPDGLSREGFWDTLALAQSHDPHAKDAPNDWAYTVHMPKEQWVKPLACLNCARRFPTKQMLLAHACQIVAHV
jgi:hypothetical protein